ncbi:MAG: hypothetical protein KAS47_04675 [Candidatus Heimdallarchaeota archaeon]|nr:hypothetical protein [Candidatus Heimdallarchaeota archaeon]
MQKSSVRRISFLAILVMLTLVTSANITKAEIDYNIQTNSVIEQSGYIQASDGGISEEHLVRGEKVNIFATLANFGDLPLDVVSLTAHFKHLDGNVRFDYNYTINFDYNHRTLEPGGTFTGTIVAEVVNIEAKYNLSIYFKAEDVYDSTSEFGAAAIDFIAAENITVSVVDLGSSASGTIIGLGITFTIMVLSLFGLIFYGWLKERLAKRKYK